MASDTSNWFGRITSYGENSYSKDIYKRFCTNFLVLLTKYSYLIYTCLK